MLFHRTYTSVATRPLGVAEIANLVKHSRVSYASHNLTGILLYVGRTFFQVLEGEADAIEALYAKILVDPRHPRITRIIFDPIPRRCFEDSNMSLAVLSPELLSELIEDPNPAQTEQLLADLDEGRAKRLLRAFSDGRWRDAKGMPAKGQAVPA